MGRLCKDCNADLVGRSDKKFCGDACRSNYYNQLHAEERKLMNSINSILRRNRRVLDEMRRSRILKSSKEDLLGKGFNFSFFTHRKTDRGFKTSYYCYDLGYQQNKEGNYILLKDQD